MPRSKPNPTNCIIFAVSLASEIKRHHIARKSQDKDLLAHVENIQHKARDVLDKLGES